jgi:hypothetical protein
MAVTQNTYTGNGSTVLFSFTFPYLETTDIKVSVNGTITTAYTLANATTIQFNTAPANGAAIRIYRVTDDAALAAQFYPGSAIRSQDLNDNFTQNLYVTQESNRDASSAITTANDATVTANGAVSTANAATATANSAVSTANAATASAASATASAASAVTTANAASASAASAVSTANTANTNATAALNAAAEALAYVIVANVAAIPASPVNGDAVRVTDSTGIQSFTPLTGVPVGFIGDAGLTVEIYYSSSSSTWVWVRYYATNPDTRYQSLAGMSSYAPLASPTFTGTPTGPSFSVTGSTVPTNGIYLPSTNNVAISTNGVARLTATTTEIASALPVGISNGVSQASTPTLSVVGGTFNTSGQGGSITLGNAVGTSTGAAVRLRSGLNGFTSGFANEYGFFCIDTNDSTGLAERLRVTSDGKVGIGTTTVNRALEVNANNGTNNVALPALRLKTGTTAGAAGYGTAIEFTTQASNNSEFVSAKIESIYTDATNLAGDLRFYTTAVGNNLAERARFNSSGALGLSGANYGSSGQVLTSQGSGAAPQWADAGGGLTLLSTINASSAVNSVDLTSGFSSSYNDYLITINNFAQNSGELNFLVSTNGGSTWISNNIYFWVGGVVAATNMTAYPYGQLKGPGFTSANSAGNFAIQLYGFYASTPKMVISDPTVTNGTARTYQRIFNSVNETGNVNAFRIKAEGANTISGTFKLYGVTKQ